MKGAAKCEKHCELQNSVSQLGFECMLRLREGLQARLLQCLYTNGWRLVASLCVSRHQFSERSGCVFAGPCDWWGALALTLGKRGGGLILKCV